MKASATFRRLLGECRAVWSDALYWKYRRVGVGSRRLWFDTPHGQSYFLCHVFQPGNEACSISNTINT